MNSAHINPFVQSAQHTLGMICNESPSLGSLYLKKAPFSNEGVSIFIDIFGDIKGSVVYNLKVDVACSIASKMMFGMPVTHLDEMSQSAISELGNMISGNVATNFSGKGIVVDITPPKFKMQAAGSDYGFVPAGKVMVCIPLKFADGSIFEIDVYIQD